MPVLRVAHEAQRKDRVRLAALALRRLRGQRGPFHRHRGARPGRLRRLAALQGLPGRHARAGPHVQAQVRAVLGDMADGSAENVGVSRSGDAPPKAARVNGESRRRGGSGPLPNPESKRPCYAASTFSASSRLARIIFLAASVRSAAGLPGASGSFFRLSSYSFCILS